MLCLLAAPQSVALLVKFLAGRIGRASLRRAAEVCVYPRSATSKEKRCGAALPTALQKTPPLSKHRRHQQGEVPVAAVYLSRRSSAKADDRRHHGFVAGVAVAVAGGCTFGLGMGPDGIGSGVGVPCNFASRNLFRCCAS